MAALLPVIARHPVVAFSDRSRRPLTAAIPPIVNAQVLPFDLPLHGVLGGVLGVGVGAFLVTGVLQARPLLILLGAVCGWSRCAGIWSAIHRSGRSDLDFTVIYGSQVLAAATVAGRERLEVFAVFLLQLVLRWLAEEIGFTGFLQHHWQDRYHAMKLTL
jgi:membrane protease YdiL (CAAX protease family)